MTASAEAMIVCSSSSGSSESRSSWTERLLVFTYANTALRSGPPPSPTSGAIARVGLPPGRSILITSAPKSARSFPQYSPATDSASSTILIPVSADMPYLETSGLGAPRAAQAPLRREVEVVVLHHVVEALLERATGEVNVVLHVVLDQGQHALDHAGQQAAEVLALVLLVQLEEGLLHRDGVGRAGPRAGQRVLLGLGLQLVARHHAVDKAAIVHLLRAERPSSEEHFGELAQTHCLGPPPQPRSPADVAESRVPEQGVVGRDHQVGAP